MEAWQRKESGAPVVDTNESPATSNKEGFMSWTSKLNKKFSEAKITAKTKMAGKETSPEELKAKDQDRLESLKKLLAVTSLVILKVQHCPSFFSNKRFY